MVLHRLACHGPELFQPAYRPFSDRLERRDSRFGVPDVPIQPAGCQVLPERTHQSQTVDLGSAGPGRNYVAQSLDHGDLISGVVRTLS